MTDSGAVKQFFKDAEGPEALKMFEWITGAMEVRGLIQIPDAKPAKKRRSDFGTTRNPVNGSQQQSLTGLPDEDQK